ncbi:MAG TPA: YggT family protein [Ktedonosporobacter sp.]|jgi:YggT family protein|nr:YggT family protein [Ktedonosporobacter sp.]
MFVPSPLPFPIVSLTVRIVIGAIIIAMLIRAFASWFRIDERYAFIRFCAYMSDPFIRPLRRYVPPVGMIDLSFLIAWFMLGTLEVLLLQSLPLGW